MKIILTSAVLLWAGLAFASGCSQTEPSASDQALPRTTTAVEATAVVPDHGSHAMGTRAQEALQAKQGKDFDIAFLSQMISHHQGAIDMAKQALATAKEPETKDDAQKVIEAQTREIAQMNESLTDWYQVEPSTEQQELMREDMAAMMAMPVQTDKMFYEMMIPHHQGALEMSALVDEKSERAEMKTLATEILTSQAAEIKAYQERLSALPSE